MPSYSGRRCLREAWTAAEERAKARTASAAGWQRRSVGSRREAVVDQAHVVAIRDLTARLDAADAVLRQHDGECAEYDVTLAMGARRRTRRSLSAAAS